MSKTLFLFLESPSKEKHLHFSLLKSFVDRDFEVKIVYFSGQKEQSVLPFPKVFLSPEPIYKKLNFHILWRLVGVLRQNKKIIILCQRHKLLTYALLSSFFIRVPIIYHVQSTNVIRNLKRKIFLKFFRKKISAVVAVSKGVRDYLLNSKCFSGNQIKLIYNGIDLGLFDIDISRSEARKFFALPENKFLFGMSARFKKAKDHRGLIKAFSLLKRDKTFEEAKLVLAGDGPTKAEVLKTIEMLGLSDDVLVLSWINPSQIPSFLKALDVFVHPSWREGIPTAVMEAMAARLPVITTDAEGLPDIFAGQEKIGFMVPKGQPEYLAEAMRKLFLLAPQERKQWGENAFQRIKTSFSAEKMGENFVNLAQEVMDSFYAK